MQIFLLSLNPKKAARALCDKHCVKMPTEMVQILSTVWKLSNPVLYQQFYMNGWLYKPFRNYKHPAILWAMQSRQNYWYCVWLLAELCQEYTFRYKKVHYCQRFVNWFGEEIPRFCSSGGLMAGREFDEKDFKENGSTFERDGSPPLPDVGFVHMTEKFQAIPEELKRDDAVEAYRAYYLRDKRRFAVWNKGRAPPKWWR